MLIMVEYYFSFITLSILDNFVIVGVGTDIIDRFFEYLELVPFCSQVNETLI